MLINKSLSLVLALGISILSPTIDAAEGGSSSYLQGTYGDFATGMLGPKGFYLRNDFIYYEASIPYRDLGRPIDGHVTQAVWGDLLKFAYVSESTFFGGRYNAALLIPVLFGSQVTRHIAGRPPTEAANDNISGLGDIYITPAALGWSWDDHHLNANVSFIAPTGGYDESQALSAGRNYWSFDPNLSYTWLHATRGHELTLTLGYLINGENSDTQYTTGDELHLDWTIAQHFSAQFAIGITGYWYEQTTHDAGEMPTGYNAADFDASSVGFGAAILYTPTIAAHHVSFIAKWITDTETRKRLAGDVYLLSLALKL